MKTERLAQATTSLLKSNSCRKDKDVDLLLKKNLLQPLQDLSGRPGKNIRSELFDICFDMFSLSPKKKKMNDSIKKQLSEIFEMLHMGSLIIDDIQDNSTMRRGSLALHRVYGIPLALNAGNWLYFYPLYQIHNLKVSDKIKNILYRSFHQMLLSGHCGQALDLGVDVTTLKAKQIEAVYASSASLKTGGLTALAASLAPQIAQASPSIIRALEKFGLALGLALQMFDDLGNLSLEAKKQEKYFEDILNRRVTWVWVVAATELNAKEFREFKNEILLAESDVEKLSKIIDHYRVAEFGRIKAKKTLLEALSKLKDRKFIEHHAFQKLCRLSERLIHAYGC